MSENDDGTTVHPDRLREGPEARLDFLLARDILVERDDGTIHPTSEFEDDRAVYVDSYRDSSDAAFRETVASIFGLSSEEAAERIDDLGLTRWDVATYLSVRSSLDVDLPEDVLLELADLVAATGEASPVPADMREVTDEDYEEFIAEAGDAVLFVFSLHCDPCDAMKAELDETRSLAPDGVAFAAVDGDDATAIRRAYEITVAPTTLVFADGEHVETREGYCAPDDLGAILDDAYADRGH